MSAPTPEFLAYVKDALEELYDPVHLREHPLIRLLLPESSTDAKSTVAALRQILLDAIDTLRPTPSGVLSRRNRVYQILQMRYVEALSYREVMTQLGLSQTQYHREQRHALEAIATVLWERAELLRDQLDQEAMIQQGRGESVFSVGEASCELNGVLGSALEILRPLICDKRVVINAEVPSRSIALPINRTAVRQIIISLILHILNAAIQGMLDLGIEEHEHHVILNIKYVGQFSLEALHSASALEHVALARRLVQPIGGNFSIQHDSNTIAITVTLPMQRHLLLVIEDNADMVRLITRFIADRSYSVLSAPSVKEGIARARDSKPEIVILDIMMPDQDGWDALQQLKHDPVTQDIPVVACTILGEEQLALALGASAFLRKPLTREALLTTLTRLLGREPHLEAGPRESPEWLPAAH